MTGKKGGAANGALGTLACVPVTALARAASLSSGNRSRIRTSICRLPLFLLLLRYC